MKKLIILSLVIVSAFTACESTEEETTTTVAPPPAAIVTSPAATSTDTLLEKPVPVNPNITQVQVQTPVTQVPAPPINMASAPKLNPAHGQPGHRCDISVGAPLPTGGAPTAAAAQAATAPQPQPQPVQMTVPPPPPPVMRATPSTAGKMLNPAHGQPGHRCDIAVGAPLN